MHAGPIQSQVNYHNAWRERVHNVMFGQPMRFHGQCGVEKSVVALETLELQKGVSTLTAVSSIHSSANTSLSGFQDGLSGSTSSGAGGFTRRSIARADDDPTYWRRRIMEAAVAKRVGRESEGHPVRSSFVVGELPPVVGEASRMLPQTVAMVSIATQTPPKKTSTRLSVSSSRAPTPASTRGTSPVASRAPRGGDDAEGGDGAEVSLPEGRLEVRTNSPIHQAQAEPPLVVPTPLDDRLPESSGGSVRCEEGTAVEVPAMTNGLPSLEVRSLAATVSGERLESPGIESTPVMSLSALARNTAANSIVASALSRSQSIRTVGGGVGDSTHDVSLMGASPIPTTRRTPRVPSSGGHAHGAGDTTRYEAVGTMGEGCAPAAPPGGLGRTASLSFVTQTDSSWISAGRGISGGAVTGEESAPPQPLRTGATPRSASLGERAVRTSSCSSPPLDMGGWSAGVGGVKDTTRLDSNGSYATMHSSNRAHGATPLYAPPERRPASSIGRLKGIALPPPPAVNSGYAHQRLLANDGKRSAAPLSYRKMVHLASPMEPAKQQPKLVRGASTPEDHSAIAGLNNSRPVGAKSELRLGAVVASATHFVEKSTQRHLKQKASRADGERLSLSPSRTITLDNIHSILPYFFHVPGDELVEQREGSGIVVSGRGESFTSTYSSSSSYAESGPCSCSRSGSHSSSSHESVRSSVSDGGRLEQRHQRAAMARSPPVGTGCEVLMPSLDEVVDFRTSSNAPVVAQHRQVTPAEHVRRANDEWWRAYYEQYGGRCVTARVVASKASEGLRERSSTMLVERRQSSAAGLQGQGPSLGRSTTSLREPSDDRPALAVDGPAPSLRTLSRLAEGSLSAERDRGVPQQRSVPQLQSRLDQERHRALALLSSASRAVSPPAYRPLQPQEEQRRRHSSPSWSDGHSQSQLRSSSLDALDVEVSDVSEDEGSMRVSRRRPSAQ